jgi:SAM-dependent methyltransferase
MATMKSLLDIVNRIPEPTPWTEGDNIPWNDPDFSERMLAEHLSQEHDLASRRSATIDEHVDWIFSTVLDGRPGRLLDLGCGPGFYVHRLSARGCECVGIDFSPASIRYAKETAIADNLPCRFVLADLREEPFGVGFDTVMMIYGQFNVFPRRLGMEILRKAHAALVPGGRLLLELQSAAQVRKDGESGPTWCSAPSGLFSHQPHLVLQENFWDPEAAASTTRFYVIDAQSASVSGYALSNEAYTEEELDDALRTAGFREVQRFPSLTGLAVSGETDLPVVAARH